MVLHLRLVAIVYALVVLIISLMMKKQRFLLMNKKNSIIYQIHLHIYLAIGGTLAAVICIKDPVREEAKQVIADLHALGIKKVVMMTGDSKRNAQRVADELGIDEVHAEVLPEDKASYVKQAKAEGYTVMMVGDGINDSQQFLKLMLVSL